MLAKPALFLSSYAPLLFMLALRFEETWLRVACAVLGVLGILLLVWFFAASRAGGVEEEREVRAVSNAGAAASAYLAGYILPFVALSDPGVYELIAYLMFFVVAYAVNAKTGLLQVNPLIYLMPGRSLQMVTFAEGKSCLVVARGNVRVGDLIYLRPVGNEDVYVMVLQ